MSMCVVCKNRFRNSKKSFLERLIYAVQKSLYSLKDGISVCEG